MSEAPERIWIEDEFGEGDDDQWTYGSWDVRNYRGYVVEYIRADLALPAVQPVAVHLCECGMTGPCKWTECKAPILSAHVNETPKSEHDAANVLTPAAKGGA